MSYIKKNERFRMLFERFVLAVSTAFFLSSCYATREPITAPSQNQSNEKTIQSMSQVGVFEGTFTRRVKGGSFIEATTGEKWQLDVANSAFYQRTWEADKKAKNLGYKTTVLGVSKVKLKGKLSEPSEKMKSFGYKAVLRIEEIYSVEPVKDVIPHDCMRKFIPCSSS